MPTPDKKKEKESFPTGSQEGELKTEKDLKDKVFKEEGLTIENNSEN